jgi:CPA2 family monovalent cation:H+ antiporter-2
VLHLVHELTPSLPVIVRSHDDTDLDRLKQAGAAEVVPELMEGSLMLASHALVMLGVPLRRVVHRVQAAREERYASLRGYFHGMSDVDEEADMERLHSVTLNGSASCVGRWDRWTWASGAEVASIRRGKAAWKCRRNDLAGRRRGGAARRRRSRQPRRAAPDPLIVNAAGRKWA